MLFDFSQTVKSDGGETIGKQTSPDVTDEVLLLQSPSIGRLRFNSLEF